MTRKGKITGAVAVLGLVALVVVFAPIFPYRPYRLLKPDDGWIPCDKWLTPAHCDRLVVVLDDNGVCHIRVGPRIVLIPLRLKMNREDVGNLSQKAEAGWRNAFMRNIIEGQRRPPDDFE